MLHRLKLKMNQSDDESKMNTIATDIRVKVPPSVQPASSNSSISSSGEEPLILPAGTNTSDALIVPPSLSLSLNLHHPQDQALTLNTPRLKEFDAVPPANVSVISINSVGMKRKVDELNLHQPADPVPSIVNIVSSQNGNSSSSSTTSTCNNSSNNKPSLPLHKNEAKKPRTVSIASSARTPPSSSYTPPSSSSPSPEENNISFLLASSEDQLYLNPLHCFVRRNIECFVATAKDIAAPCPGRKNSVIPGQVGLRCIHCRNVYSRNRTKRAVCYPSSVGRVYHCVSDMKFDHFSNCKYLPSKGRETFDELKASCSSKKRGKKTGLGSCNTAKYYRDSALKLGLQDGPQNGIVTLCQQSTDTTTTTSESFVGETMLSPHIQQSQHVALAPKVDESNQNVPKEVPPSKEHVVFSIPMRGNKSIKIGMEAFTNDNDHHALSTPVPHSRNQLELPNLNGTCPPPALPLTTQAFLPNEQQKVFQNRLLAGPGDEAILAPIHCFVRKNVEIFAATPEDVAAPAPGRKTRVTVGQIGIRCIHCAKLSPKQRVKRAICYPPTILSIYHSVSNMKFDHFGACRGLSVEDKQEFAALRASSNQKGGKKVNRKTTAQYYIDSAVHDLKLVNTESGIRPSGSSTNTSVIYTDVPPMIPPEQKTVPRVSFTNYLPLQNSSAADNAADVTMAVEDKSREQQSPTNGMSVLMMAATDPTMREAYEKRKQLVVGGVDKEGQGCTSNFIMSI